jgi:hypothetical protein
VKEEKLEKYLNELANATAEPVHCGLAEDIKRRIPSGIRPYKRGRDTINIIIDLRIGKLAAAAVIILTMVLCANFLGGRDAAGDSIFKDSKMLVKYIFGGGISNKDELLAGLSKYELLVKQGREVVYYGDSIELADNNAVLMHWKLSGGKYGVIFGNSRTKTVTAEQLIKLQAQMLQKKPK